MNDERLEVLLSEERIAARVTELAADISRDYEGRDLLLLCVLKGAVIFVADLARKLSIPVEIGFISASSYDGEASTGEVILSPSLAHSDHGRDVASKDVLIIEDILDTGLTCGALIRRLESLDPTGVGLCVLLDKPSDRRVEPITPDYVGFTVPDKFVVGYGLDYKEKYRDRKDIHIFSP
jgi:hypoxanthine phosphoribosyltransferase